MVALTSPFHWRVLNSSSWNTPSSSGVFRSIGTNVLKLVHLITLIFFRNGHSKALASLQKHYRFGKSLSKIEFTMRKKTSFSSSLALSTISSIFSQSTTSISSNLTRSFTIDGENKYVRPLHFSIHNNLRFRKPTILSGPFFHMCTSFGKLSRTNFLNWTSTFAIWLLSAYSSSSWNITSSEWQYFNSIDSRFCKHSIIWDGKRYHISSGGLSILIAFVSFSLVKVPYK